MMEREGIFFEPGDHTRLAGKMQVHYRLSMDDRGFPKFYVFNTCRHFIRTLPLLIYDEHKVEDVNTAGEDHIYDVLRYVLMEAPTNPPIRKKEVKDIREDPLDLWKDNYKQMNQYDFIRF